MRPYPPLGILYLAAYLKARGQAAEVFDTTFSSLAALERRLLDERPDVIGIYTNLMTKLNVLRIMRFIRARPELASSRIVLGGPEVTHHADRFLEHGADVIVIGEGEETLHALVAAWASGGRDAAAGRHRRHRVARRRRQRRAHTATAAAAQPGRSPRAGARRAGSAAVPDGVARPPRHERRVRQHDARLPLHVPVVQPRRLRRQLPAAHAAPGRRRDRAHRRALPPRFVLVRRRRVHDQSPLAGGADRRARGARRARPVRVHHARRPAGRTVGRAAQAFGLLSRLDRRRERVAGGARRDGPASDRRAGAGHDPPVQAPRHRHRHVHHARLSRRDARPTSKRPSNI